MTTHLRWIGRTAGVAALALIVAATGCDRSDAKEASADKDASAAAVVKTSSSSAANESKPEEKRPPARSTETITAQPPKPDPAANDGPRLKLEKSMHDFGKIYDTSPQIYELKVTNVGTKPLTIQKISTSCGCTSTNKDDIEGHPIEPGSTVQIEVKYRPKQTASKVTKVVTIQSDDFIEPVQRFKISAQLVEPARLDPLRFQMGQIRASDGHKTQFFVVSPDPEVEIMSVESASEYLGFEVVDDPSDNPDYPGRKRIDVTVSPKIPTGAVKLAFDVKAKAAAEEGGEKVETTLTGMVLGHVRGELMNDPRFLRIRNVGAGESFEVRTMLYSENARPFKITGVRVADSTIEGVEVETVALEPFENDEPGYWVIVKGVLPDNAKGAFQGKILVATDVPNESEKAIIFNGIVRRPMPQSQGSQSKAN